MTATRRTREIYYSFFMFTVDLRPQDPAYRQRIVRHIEELSAAGYAGFDLPIAPREAAIDHAREIEAYSELRSALDDAGLAQVKFTTNVAATGRFDPTSADERRRAEALAYLQSRVDITAALRGEVMAGPIVFPYNTFPVGDSGEPLWSDALQAWLEPGYRRARPVINELGMYAESKDVKLAIEPVDHWEQPAPNGVGDVLDFLDGVPTTQVGVCPDSAHVVLGGDGPVAFAEQITRAADGGRLHYVHVSAPGRGAVRDAWIPWEAFLGPVLPRYDGPLLVETFNAIPAFHEPLHLTRRKFWVPGEDEPDTRVADAYTVAREAIAVVREQLDQLDVAQDPAVVAG